MILRQCEITPPTGIEVSIGTNAQVGAMNVTVSDVRPATDDTVNPIRGTAGPNFTDLQPM
jgi:hypothetical protein